MKSQSKTPLRAMAASAVLSAFALTSCMTSSTDDVDPTADGGNVLINEESNSMGQVVTGSEFTSTSAKSAAATADTVNVEFAVTRQKSSCLIDGAPQPCFVRSAQFTRTNVNGKTFTRTRRDTIWLDSVGDGVDHYLANWNPLHATKIIHNRHVSKVKGDIEIEIHFNTVLTWTLGPDSSKVGASWSGYITGTFNGVEFKSATINNVTRPFTPGLGFGFPTSGNVVMQRGLFKVDMEFKGDGAADCTITNKRRGTVVRTTHVKADGTES